MNFDKLLTEAITQLNDHHCPYCGKKQNAASGEGSPEPGDYGICIKCTGVAIYDERLGLRALTATEQISAIPDVTDAIAEINNYNYNR